MTLKILFIIFQGKEKTNINDIFTHMLVKYGVIRDIKCKKTRLQDSDINKTILIMFFACDPNEINKISLKAIEVLCEKIVFHSKIKRSHN
jgi:hypothetical protein